MDKKQKKEVILHRFVNNHPGYKQETKERIRKEHKRPLIKETRELAKQADSYDEIILNNRSYKEDYKQVERKGRGIVIYPAALLLCPICNKEFRGKREKRKICKECLNKQNNG